MSRIVSVVSACMIALFVLLIPPSVKAEDGSSKEQILISGSDLFFYDESGKKTPLAFAAKLLMRDISSSVNVDSLAEHLKELSSLTPIAIENISELGSNYFLVSFLPGTSFEDLIAVIESISEKKDVIEAMPVFTIGGRTVIIDGVIIESRVEFSPGRLIAFLQKVFGFNEADIRQIKTDGNNATVWFNDLFFLSVAKVPLEMLTFANLLNNSPDSELLVKRARPNFVFLDEPVSAAVNIFPVTGTIGEERTLALTVRICDKNVVFDENLLPVFGKGNFIPRVGGTNIADAFFRVKNDGAVESYEDDFCKVIVRAWEFNAFAAEQELTVPEVSILFELDGQNLEQKTKPRTFVNLLHTGQSIKFSDLPPAKTLPVPDYRGAMQNTAFSSTQYWFDSLMKQQYSKVVSSYALYLGLIIFVTLIIFWAYINARSRRMLQKENDIHGHNVSFVEDMEKKYKNLAMETHSFGCNNPAEKLIEIEKDIVAMFRVIFQKFLYEQFSVAQMKEFALGDSVFDAFFKNNADLLKSISEKVNKRHAPQHAFEYDEITALFSDVTLLFNNLAKYYRSIPQ